MADLESHMQELSTLKAETSDQLIKKVAEGGGIGFAGSIVDKGVRFLLQILLGRVLGVDSYGLYSLGYSLITIGSQISLLGLPSGVVRFVALYKGAGDIKRIKGILIVAFVTSTLSSIAAGGLLFLFSRRVSQIFNMPQLAGVLRIFAVALPFCAIIVIMGYSARAFQVIKYDAAVRNIVHPIGNIVIVSVMLLFGFRLLGAVYGFLISSAVSACFGLYLLKRIFPEIVSGLEPSYEFKKIFRFSLPVFLVGFSYLMLLQTDRLMLGYFRASKDLGIYAAAATISYQTELITYSFCGIFSPIVSDLYARREFNELQNLYKTITRWILSLNLLLLVLLMSFSKQIMGMFGSEFTSGWLVLVVLSGARLVSYGAGAALPGYVLPMAGKQDIELVNAIVVGVLNIALNFWLIRIYGMLGAAIATGLSNAVVEIAKIVEVHRLLGMLPYDTKYYKPLFAGFIVMFLSVFLSVFNVLGSYWILNLVILSVVYSAVLYFLGLEREDMVLLKVIIKRRLISD